MTLLAHALWLLCGIGAVVFAAAGIRGWRSGALGAAGLAAGAVAARVSSPDPAAIGILAGLAAIVALTWPRHALLTSAAAGALAGVWSSLLQLQGAPLPFAVAMAAAVPAWSAWLACRRPRFAPPLLRDEALLVTFVVAMVVALVPGVVDGWRAALALNVTAAEASPIPAWTLGLGCASLVLGALYSTWSRR